MKKLLSVEDLAALLGRSAETIMSDIRRKPDAVPPRIVVPGTRLLRWRREDVEAWLARHVEGSTAAGRAE